MLNKLVKLPCPNCHKPTLYFPWEPILPCSKCHCVA